MSSIKVSPKHGVNPTIPICFYCGEPKNEVILAGRLPGDVEAPHGMVWDKRPCQQCEEWMQKGILLISVRNGESGNNPYRSGKLAVVTDDAFRRIFDNHAALTSRVAFVDDETWAVLGLPQ